MIILHAKASRRSWHTGYLGASGRGRFPSLITKSITSGIVPPFALSCFPFSLSAKGEKEGEGRIVAAARNLVAAKR